MSVELILGDCLEKMKDIPDKSIDLVLTDPPYGTTTCEWDIVATGKEYWKEALRVAKDNSAIIKTAREPFTSKLVYENIKLYRHKWIWNKGQTGNFALAKICPLQIEEDVLVFGKNKVNYYPIMRKGIFRKKGGGEGIETCGGMKNNGRFNDDYYPVNILNIINKRIGEHPTQKPVELMAYLIKTYSKEGDTILDPFMGSGTTGVACVKLDRNFIGIEIDPKYFEIAKRRITEEEAKLKLF